MHATATGQSACRWRRSKVQRCYRTIWSEASDQNAFKKSVSLYMGVSQNAGNYPTTIGLFSLNFHHFGGVLGGFSLAPWW